MMPRLVFCGAIRRLCEEIGAPVLERAELESLYKFVAMESEASPEALHVEDIDAVLEKVDAASQSKEMFEAVGPIIARLKRKMKKHKLRIADIYSYIEPDLTKPVPLHRLAVAMTALGDGVLIRPHGQQLEREVADDVSGLTSVASYGSLSENRLARISKLLTREVTGKLETMENTLHDSLQTRYQTLKTLCTEKESKRLLSVQAQHQVPPATGQILERLLQDRDARVHLYEVISSTWAGTITANEMQRMEVDQIIETIAARAGVEEDDVARSLQLVEETLTDTEEYAHFKTDAYTSASAFASGASASVAGSRFSGTGTGAGAVSAAKAASLSIDSDLPPILLQTGRAYSSRALALSDHLNSSKPVGHHINPKSATFKTAVRVRARVLVNNLASYDKILAENRKIMASF
jgi:CTP-dependent riboflavin kinase